MKRIKKKLFIIHPLLFAIYPIVFLFSHNRAQLTYSVLTLPVLVIISITIILFILLSKIIKDQRKASISVSLFLILLFSYGHVFSSAEDLLSGSVLISAIKHRYMLVVWLGLLVIGSYLIFKTKKNLSSLTKILNFIAISMLILPGIRLVNYEIESNSAIREITQLQSDEVINSVGTTPNDFLPDIYYIVLDSYAASSVLEETYNYQNEVFEKNLLANGFFIASESVTNYPYTHLSLASSLNMQYINFLTDIVGEEAQDEEVANKMIETNKVVELLKSEGYEYIHFSSGWGPTNYSSRADENLQPGVIDEFSAILLRTTALSPFEFTKPFMRKRILFTFDGLAEMAGLAGPKFVFAHILLPHPPWLFGPNGEEIKKSEVAYYGDVWEQKDFYLGQVTFTNKKVLNLINTLLKESESPPVIILQADHGPGTTKETAGSFGKEEKMRIFNAFFVPCDGQENFYTSITPVNTFRLIFNACFGSNFELLEDKNYYSEYNSPYLFVDVTNELTL